MLPNIGWGELIVIFGIVLLVFGPKRLPELAQSMGKAVRLFKESLHGDPENPNKPEQGK
jgi:sec-independent protein translocase protein TatA